MCFDISKPVNNSPGERGFTFGALFFSLARKMFSKKERYIKTPKRRFKGGSEATSSYHVEKGA